MQPVICAIIKVEFVNEIAWSDMFSGVQHMINTADQCRLQFITKSTKQKPNATATVA